MKRITPLAIAFLIVACSPTPTVVPLSSPVSPENPIMVTAMPQEVNPTALMQPTSAGGSETLASLWLQIISPQDGAEVNTPQVDVTGAAPVGTVISVNDDILIVGADQQFKSTVTLEEGPNLIEIIASDDNGNEISTLLTITYEP